MKPFVLTVRAVGSEFIIRKLRATGILTGIVGLAVTLLGLWLTTISVWWWLLTGMILLSDVVFTVLYIVAFMAVQFFRPHQSGEQRTATHKFVDKLERLADNVQLPAYVILFRIVRDVVRPRKKGFIDELTTDSVTARRDFLRLIKLHNSLREHARA